MTEMTFKQAVSEARQMVRALRAFEKVEAVLAAGADAEARLSGLEEKIKLLSTSAVKWEGAVEEARGRYTAEQVVAGTEMDRLRGAAMDAISAQERKRDEALAQADREVKEALTAGELVKKRLTAQCRSLEERRAELEGKLQQAREEYDAFREKVGVN